MNNIVLIVDPWYTDPSWLAENIASLLDPAKFNTGIFTLPSKKMQYLHSLKQFFPDTKYCIKLYNSNTFITHIKDTVVESITTEVSKYSPDICVAISPFSYDITIQVANILSAKSILYLDALHTNDPFWIHLTPSYIFSIHQEFLVQEKEYILPYPVHKKALEAYPGNIEEIYAMFGMQKQPTILLSLLEDHMDDVLHQIEKAYLPDANILVFLPQENSYIPTKERIYVCKDRTKFYDALLISDIHILHDQESLLYMTLATNTIPFVLHHKKIAKYIEAIVKDNKVGEIIDSHHIEKHIQVLETDKAVYRKHIATFLQQEHVYEAAVCWNKACEDILKR